MVIRGDEGAPALTFIFRALSLQQTCFRNLGVKSRPSSPQKYIPCWYTLINTYRRTKHDTSPREKTDEKTPHPVTVSCFSCRPHTRLAATMPLSTSVVNQRLAGQYSSREAFARHGGGGGLGAAAIAMTEWDAKSHQLGSSNSNSSTGSANGFSSPSFSLGEVGHSQHQQEYNANTNNKHHHQHNHQQHQTPLMRGGGGGNNNSLSRNMNHGGGQGGISQHIHNHPSIVIDSSTVSRHQLSSPMLPSDHHTPVGNNSLGDRGGNNTPGRPGMSVQDLKNMTAMRMAQQQQQHSGPASPVSGTGNQQHHPMPASLSAGGRTPTLVGNNTNKNSGNVQQGMQIVPPRRRASPSHAGLVVSQQHEGGGGRLSQQQQQQQQLLRQQREPRDVRELRELREHQQAAMASPMLRLSNSQGGGGGVSSGGGGGAGRPPQVLVTQVRAVLC